MDFARKLLNPSVPMALFEMVPPPHDNAAGAERAAKEVKEIAHLVDGINIPEIHNESRDSARTAQFVPRVEPRVLARRIRQDVETEIVLNRCVVYEPDQLSWFKSTREEFGTEHVVLVGGESSTVSYPGPSVIEAANQARHAGLPMTFGGITIPSRRGEAERIRAKKAAGLVFFTTQVLFDSNDIVGLVQRLNGLEARVFLSFAPVSHPRDLEFLRWLGADIPLDLDQFLLGEGEGKFTERSLDLAQRILMDVFDNLPPEPPPLGLNVEHINRRNFQAAVKMLDRLGNLYRGLVAQRARASLA